MNEAAKAKSIFLLAIGEHQSEQWPNFLDAACGDDNLLRAEVEKLLQAHTELGTFHENIPEETTVILDQTSVEKVGQSIGHYKLVEKLGDGGMGSVYLASQKEPV